MGTTFSSGTPDTDQTIGEIQPKPLSMRTPNTTSNNNFNERTPLIGSARNSKLINNRVQLSCSSDEPQSSAAYYWAKLIELFSTSKYAISIHCFLLLATALGNSIYFKKMLDHMPNHIYFVNQFTSVLYVPIFYIIVLYQQLFTESITTEMTQFPKMKFVWMGIFDGISGLFMMFGAVHTSGSIQALLANAVIPVTMYMSYLYLKTRYNKHQIIGATVIMLGIGVVLLPQLLSSIFGDGDDDRDSAENTKDIPLFNLLFLLSVVPMALSSIYKEAAFDSYKDSKGNDVDIDINYMQYWTSNFQMIIGFLLIPFSTMSFLGNQALSWSELITAIPEGWNCLMGHNVVVRPHCRYGITDIPMHGLPPCDNCPGSYLPMLLYMFFNMTFNLFTVTVIKFGGSTLMFVVMTLRLPLTQFAFSLSFIQNPPDVIEWPTLVGLMFILAGLGLYKYSGKSKDEDDEFSIPPILGMTQAYNAVRHERVQLRLARTAREVRKKYYEELNIIDSPKTPSRRHRESFGGASPLTGSSSRTPIWMRESNTLNNNNKLLNNHSRSVSMDNLKLDSFPSITAVRDTDQLVQPNTYDTNAPFKSSGLRNTNEHRINLPGLRSSNSVNPSNT